MLFGDANPCGKLAETFPKRIEDNPSYLFYVGEEDRVEYREGVFVGYRYYDKKKIEPLFTFGNGLSYTSFVYSGFSVANKEMQGDQTVVVQIKVTNTGNRSGTKIVQLYIREVNSKVIRPDMELKGFTKVELQPGEEQTVHFTLERGNVRSASCSNVRGIE